MCTIRTQSFGTIKLTQKKSGELERMEADGEETERTGLQAGSKMREMEGDGH